MSGRASQARSGRDRQVLLVAVIVVVQAVAAMFFVADAVDDLSDNGLTLHIAIEGLIAFALLAGVVLGARHTRLLLSEARRREAALEVARGALAEHVTSRFAEWELTPAEAEVALFALKGCDIAEISDLRGAAQGTVRAQLSSIYAKAGVTSQAALVSLFFDELL